MEWRRFARPGLRTLVLGLAAALAAACAGTRSDPLAATALALDRGIDALADSSADFRAVLRGLASQLPNHADTAVLRAVTRFLDRAPPASADFECDAAFVNRRARQELIRIEDALLRTAAAPPEPEFCYAAPFAVDLTRAPNTVEIYGYDFDLVPLEMVLVASDGYHDVSTALVRRTHYHLTLVLGEGGVRLSGNARSLGLTWGNLIHHAIPIVAPGTPFCSCTIEEIPAGRTVEFAPSRIRRDAHAVAQDVPPSARANVLLDYSSNELSATLCMSVAGSVAMSVAGSVAKSGAGSGADRAASAAGCVRAFVLTVDPDRSIEWLFGRPDARAIWRGPGDSIAEGAPANGGGIVRRWRFAGLASDSAGPRIGVELGPIRLVTTGGGECISPIAYLEARRSGSLSSTTVRALDRQLQKFAPEILALHPRFAPH